MNSQPYAPVDKLNTAEQIAIARLRLMTWHEEMQRDYPDDPLWADVRMRVATAITIRAITLGLEPVA